MLKTTIILIVCCVGYSVAGIFDKRDYSLVAQAFKNHDISPKYIDAPTALLQVRYFDDQVILNIILAYQ